MEIMDVWELLAGLGIFLFGMYLMEESIRLLSGRAFKHFIRRYTSTRLRGIISGTVATAVLQSSSAVSLMILAFTGAGIMTTLNAIGVVIGSNLGTTVTAWVVASVGFKLKIEILSLPFIGIGGLILIFLGKSVRWVNVSKLLVGFGFLFMGLDYMKQSVEAMAMEFDIGVLDGLPRIVYAIAGLVLTALIQSSSAALAIVLTSLHSGLISFDTACLMVIGSNVGTTVTVIIGSIGGVSAKIKVALSHLVFNLITAIAAFFLLPIMVYVIKTWLGFGSEPVLGLAAFHSMFNLLGVILFFPFIGLLANLLDKMVKEKTATVTTFIHHAPAEIPEASILAMRKEVIRMIRLVMEHNLRILQLDPLPVLNEIKMPDGSSMPLSKESPDENYEQIKLLQTRIFNYAAAVQGQELTEEEAKELNSALHAVRYAVASAKSIRDIRHNIDDLEGSEHIMIKQFYGQYRKQALEFYMKIASMYEGVPEHEIVAQLHTLRIKLVKRDDDFLNELTSNLQRSKFVEKELASLLSANRGWVSSGRQLILASKDILLGPNEVALYDTLAETAANGMNDDSNA